MKVFEINICYLNTESFNAIYMNVHLTPNSNGLLRGQMSNYRSGQLLVLRMGNYP